MAWTKTTEEVGTCSVLNTTEVTEATCNVFNSSVWVRTSDKDVITMTGNEALGDTEDTVLSGLDGVTHSLVGTTHTYTFDADTRLQVEGTLNINTERSKIVMLRQVVSILQPSILIVEGTAGIVNFGVEKVSGSGIYTDGVGLEFAGGTIVGGGGYLNRTVGQHLSIDGTFTINGGRVKGPFNWSLTTDGEIAGSYPSKFLVYDNLTNAWNSKLRLGTISATGLTMEGGTLVLSADGGKGTYSVSRVAGDVGYQNEGNIAISDTGATNTYAIIKNVNFQSNTVDYGCYSIDHTGTDINAGNGAKLQNIEQGSAVNVNGAVISGAIDRNSNVYTIGTQKIASNLTSLADGSKQKGTILMRDTKRFSNLTVDVAGGTQKTPLSTSRSEFSDDTQFTYRGDVVEGVISTWTPLGGYAAGKLVATAGETEIVLWTFSSALIDGVNRPRAANNTGIWKRDIRGATDDITDATLDQFDFHVWTYENSYVKHTAVVAGMDDYLIEEALVSDPAIYLTLAEATSFEAGSDGNAITCTSTDIAIDGRVVDLETFYAIEKLRKTTDIEKEVVPSLGTMIVSGTTNEIDFSTRTFTMTNGGGLKIGDGGDLNKVKHDTVLSFDDFDNEGLTMTAAALTVTGNTLTIKAGCRPIGKLTKNSAFTITVETDADVSGLVLAGTGTFTSVGATESDYNIDTSATVIEAFTHTIEIDTSAVGACNYRVVYGSTDVFANLSLLGAGTVGSIAASANSHTITLSSMVQTVLTRDEVLIVCVTAADGSDLRHITTVQDITEGIKINKDSAYNSGSTANSKITGSLNAGNDTYTIKILAGVNEGAAVYNKSIGLLKTSQNYCDFIAFNGVDNAITHSSTINTTLPINAGNIRISTAKDGTTFTAVQIQGVTSDNSTAITSESSPVVFIPGTETSDDGDATAVPPVEPSLTVTIGLVIKGSTEVDYAEVGSTIKSIVQEPLTKISLFIPVSSNDFD